MADNFGGLLVLAFEYTQQLATAGLARSAPNALRWLLRAQRQRDRLVEGERLTFSPGSGESRIAQAQAGGGHEPFVPNVFRGRPRLEHSFILRRGSV